MARDKRLFKHVEFELICNGMVIGVFQGDLSMNLTRVQAVIDSVPPREDESVPTADDFGPRLDEFLAEEFPMFIPSDEDIEEDKLDEGDDYWERPRLKIRLRNK